MTQKYAQRTSIATNIELANITTAIAPPPGPLPDSTALEQPPVAPEPINGPSQGPTVSLPPMEEDFVDEAPPGSPYTSTRAMIQNLTLPTIPNFDIPPSPPGSPPQRATKKFAQFLELKRQGQHFNQRLEGSSVLRDPGHLGKLLDFAGISEEQSHASTLSDDVAVPTVYPDWAYVEELRASQKRITKIKELERSKAPREAIDFVSATKSGTSSGTGTPSGKARQNAAERHVAGAEEKAAQSSSQNPSKRKQLEHRGKDDSSKSGWRSRSRSPKRRRSKSRDRR